jgi:hypothetical protein
MRLLHGQLSAEYDKEYDQANASLGEAGRKLSPVRDSHALIEMFDKLNREYREELGDQSRSASKNGIPSKVASKPYRRDSPPPSGATARRTTMPAITPIPKDFMSGGNALKTFDTIWVSSERHRRRCSFIAFLIREFRHGQPLVNLRALKDRNLAIGCLLIFVLGAGIYSVTTILPLFFQTLMGWDRLMTPPLPLWQAELRVFARRGTAGVARPSPPFHRARFRSRRRSGCPRSGPL